MSKQEIEYNTNKQRFVDTICKCFRFKEQIPLETIKEAYNSLRKQAEAVDGAIVLNFNPENFKKIHDKFVENSRKYAKEIRKYLKAFFTNNNIENAKEKYERIVNELGINIKKNKKKEEEKQAGKNSSVFF